MDEYKPPSLLAQHKGLAMVFAIVLLAVTVYLYKVPRTPIYFPPPTQSVYIEAIPQNAPRLPQNARPAENPTRPSTP